MEIIVPKAGTFSGVLGDGTSNSPVNVTINRSDKLEVEIEVKQRGSTLGWQLSTKANDIGFAVHHTEGESKKEIVEYKRIDCSSEPTFGSLEDVSAGTYLFLFDNTFSYMRSKNLTYQVTISPPLDDSLRKIKSRESEIEDDDDDDEDEGEDEDSKEGDQN